MADSRTAILTAMQTAMRPLSRRLRALASRALIARADDGGKLQTVQVTALAGERLDDVQRLQYFGHSAVPPPGSTCLLISIAGSRTHCLVIGGEHDSRPRDLDVGESQVYNSHGDHVWLKATGEIVIHSSSLVTINSPHTHVTGTMTVDGALLSNTSVADPLGSMQEMRDINNAHRHTGVQSGGATSGLTNMPMT